jgi:hypothetical protein
MVECNWQKKGKVMRQLIEESRTQPVEMIEGVKIFFEGGWVLIFPDPAEPYLHINVEAASPQQCDEIVNRYKEKVLAMSKSDYLEKPKAARKAALKKDEAKAAASGMGIHLPEERAFHFWLPGRYLGLKATSLREFAEILLFVDLGSLDYHLQRGDFANWIEYELLNPKLAQKIRLLKEKGVQGEELRQQLVKLLQ